jgi:hypothetical protein
MTQSAAFAAQERPALRQVSREKQISWLWCRAYAPKIEGFVADHWKKLAQFYLPGEPEVASLGRGAPVATQKVDLVCTQNVTCRYTLR